MINSCKVKLRLAFFILPSLILLQSCISVKRLNYFQDAEIAENEPIDQEKAIKEIRRIKVRPFDIIRVDFKTDDNRLNNLLNMSSEPQAQIQALNNPSYYNSLSVSQAGTIKIPVLGEFEVAGKDLREIEQILTDSLSYFTEDPFISAKYVVYNVYILGETNSPGRISIPRESSNLMEAIGLSNDLALFANRSNIKVYRDIGNGMKVYELDLTSIQSLNSQGFYIYPHDIIYIEPLKRKTFLTNVNAFNVLLGVANTIVGVIILTTR